MLEQQDSNYSGESGGVGANVFPLLINGCKPDTDDTGDASGSRSESVDLLEKVGGDEIGGERERRSESRDSINSVKGQLGQDGGESDDLSTATTTVRIHTTYKKRASKFMNRPNVQNGLGANPLLNPYGSGGSIHSAGLGGNPGGRIFGGGNYNGNNSTGGNYNSACTNNVNPDNSFSTGASRSRHKRSFTTRNSVHGGSNSSGGGTTSPNNNGPSSTTASSSTATTVESRPPFVTTVTRGRFLPSKFDLMVEKSLFTFSSRPKPVGLITKHHCSLSGPLRDSNSQNSQPRGAHDYFNVMWDPHVYRGTTTTLTSSLKQPDSTDLSSSREERHRKKRTYLHGSQNTLNNSSSTILNPVGGGTSTTTIRSNRYKMTTKVTSRSRTFPPPEGRHQVHVQTEEYLEDLSRDMTRGPEVDAIVQTDPIEDEELLLSPLVNAFGGVGRDTGKGLPVATGIDASTQVLPGELITFDERVQPVVEAVVGKILEQALLETMEEEEIGALKAQQNRFLEKRKEEERELKRLQEQQERISAEKERLKRHLEMQFKQRQGQQSNADGINGGSGESSTAILTESGVLPTDGNMHNGALSTADLLELLPSVIQSLREEGVLLEDQDGDAVLLAAGLPFGEKREVATGDNGFMQLEKREDSFLDTAFQVDEETTQTCDENEVIDQQNCDDNPLKINETSNDLGELNNEGLMELEAASSNNQQGDDTAVGSEADKEDVKAAEETEGNQNSTEIIEEATEETATTPIADQDISETNVETSGREQAVDNANGDISEECLEPLSSANIPNGEVPTLMQE